MKITFKETDNFFGFYLEPENKEEDLIPFDYKAVLPAGKVIYSTAIDVSLLVKICNAIGTKNVKLDFYKNAIKVTLYSDSSKAEGYL